MLLHTEFSWLPPCVHAQRIAVSASGRIHYLCFRPEKPPQYGMRLLHRGISTRLMTGMGHNPLLPHRNIGVRFCSINGHTIVRPNGVVLQAPSCIIDGGAIA
jgi:hypothetical protein